MTPSPTPTPPPRAPLRAGSPALPVPAVPTRRGGWISERRPLAIVLFSVIACGLLVAAASVVPLAGNAHHAGDAKKVHVEPADYAMQATADVSALATLPDLPEADLGNLTAADAAAAAALQQKLQDAVASLQAALAEAAASLPQVPEGYVPGTEVDVDLPAAQEYRLPSLPVPDLGFGTLGVDGINVSASPVGTRSGSPLDGVLDQLEGLNSLLDSLPGGAPTDGLLDGVPVLGGSAGSPSQVQDAADTASPDETGALAASVHATSALDLTKSSYASTVSDLQALINTYSRLADTVERALAHLQDVQDAAKTDVQATLEGRLKDIHHQVSALQAQASSAVALHAKAVSAAQDAASGLVSKATAVQSAAVAAAGDAAVHDLERQVLAVQADAQQRKDAIAAAVSTAAADLGTSADAQQALQAVQAAAAAADLKVDRDAKAQVAALQSRADDVRALVERSQAQLTASADEALAQVDDAAGAAVAGDADVSHFLAAQAQAYGSLMEAREAALALKATDRLQDLADEQSQALVAQALAGTHTASASLGQASGMVKQVQTSLMGQVGKDIEYVGEVGEDYGRVPTEDRKAHAEHWSTVATGLNDALDQALGQGRTIETLAKQALVAAHQAEGEVSALA